MYARDAAEHFWPWYSNAPRTSAVATACGSAERVREDEVLAARLADEARVGAVAPDALADLAPDGLEDLGRAGEVQAGEIGVVEARARDGRRHRRARG